MEVAAKCNSCLSNPCLYGSSCTSHPSEVYKCICKAGLNKVKNTCVKAKLINYIENKS